jgi:hypothetical protein
LLLRQGHSETAEEMYRKALGIVEEQEAKVWELRAAAGLARLRHDQGRRAEARDFLAPIYGWFTEGFETGHAVEVRGGASTNRNHHQRQPAAQLPDPRAWRTAQPLDSDLGMFVGAAAYEAAGGTITRDLFSGDDDGFMDDAAATPSRTGRAPDPRAFHSLAEAIPRPLP